MKRNRHYAVAGAAVAGVLLLSSCSSASDSSSASTASGALGSAGVTGSASSASSTPASPAADGEVQTLRIGYNYVGSGPFAAFDVPLLNGMKFAADQINAQGGPVKIEIVAADNDGDQAKALSIAQDELSQGINAFVMTTHPMNIALGTTYADAGAVVEMGMVSPPTVRAAIGDRAFSLAEANTNAQAAAMAKYACDQGYTKAFILNSADMEYLAKPGGYFLDAFAKDCGGTSAGDDVFKIGDTDFGTQVTKIIDSGADVVFTPMFVPDSIAFLKKLRGAGSDVAFLSTDGQDTPAFTQAGGDAVEGAVFSTTAFPSEGSPLAKFFEEYTAATGKAPESNEYEAVGRDTIYAYLDAAKNAGNDISPDALVSGFEAIKDIPLVTGTVSMDPELNVAPKPVAVVEIKDGKPQLVSFEIPAYVPAP